MIGMAQKCSEVPLVIECHQEGMGEALSKHLLAFKVLSPAMKLMLNWYTRTKEMLFRYQMIFFKYMIHSISNARRSAEVSMKRNFCNSRIIKSVAKLTIQRT